MSRRLYHLVLVLLIARAVAAPVSLRHRFVERPGFGFHLGFHAELLPAAPEAVEPQFVSAKPESGLVFRICYWPAPRSRHGSTELARRVAKPRATAWNALPTERLVGSTAAPPPTGIAPRLSTDRYLRHALGQQRC